jgi:hypothetical protein
MNRYDVYDDRGREGEPIEEVDGTWVKYADYATVLSDCRWAMERYIEERNCFFDFVCYGGTGEIQERKASDTNYQRAQAWLDAHKERT